MPYWLRVLLGVLCVLGAAFYLAPVFIPNRTWERWWRK